jgi:ATPase subunit of ABC transporter with duplicated ATPase domains
MFTHSHSYLTVTNLTVFLNDRKLIADLQFKINPGDKVAIIGEEGNCKSTLLKIIADEPLPENIKYQGEITKNYHQFGYLPQTIPAIYHDFTTLQFLLYNPKTKEFDWDVLNDFTPINSIFAKFHLPSSWLEQPVRFDQLSGGEQIKLFLARILLSCPEIIFLDEPTNNLDLATIKWLENFIRTTTLPILYVSHDIKLLKNTATHILHLEQTKNKQQAHSTFGKSTYSEYIENRVHKLDWEETESNRQKRKQSQTIHKLHDIKNKVQTDQENILDSGTRRLLNKRMKTVISQQKKLDKQELLPAPDVEEAIKIDFSHSPHLPKYKKIIHLNFNKLTVGDKTILQKTNLEINGPAKICFTGPNGCGKSTLLKQIYHDLLSDQIKVGYLPQNHLDFFSIPEYRAIDYVRYYNSKLDESAARSLLGQLKFTPREMLELPTQLSGGQMTKLILLCLSLGNFSILILDEPTRNLSPLSLPIIISALQKFPGCLLCASHDREFIDQVFAQVYRFEDRKLICLDAQNMIQKVDL